MALCRAAWTRYENELMGSCLYDTMLETAQARIAQVSVAGYKKFMGDSVTEKEIETIVDPNTGAISNPQKWSDILTRPAAERKYWDVAKLTELKAIIEREVITQPLTAAQRRKLGVPAVLDRRPVPLHMLYTVKPTAAATGGGAGLSKFKCRLVLTGSSRYLRRGRDFWATFTAAPLCSTARIMAYIIVQCGWLPSAADIVCAYLMAKLKKEEQVVVQMDKELRTYSPDGEELMSVLEGAQYGHPASGLRFEEERNKHILSAHFNFANRNEAWSAVQSKFDPSLFVFTHVRWPAGDGPVDQPFKTNPVLDHGPIPAPGTAKLCPESKFGGGKSIVTRALMLAYVDDLDLAAQCKQDEEWIWKTMAIRFELKRTNPEQMLGLLRKITDDGTKITISMPAYIEGMYEQFRSFILGEAAIPGIEKKICELTPAKRKAAAAPLTPVPPGMYLSNEDALDIPDGVKKVRQEMLLKVLGKLLWATRMVHVTAAFAVNSCCRMVANPTEETLLAAFQIVAFLYTKKDDGIVFTKTAKPELLCYYDASNKADPADCDRAQAGFVVMLGGGPTDWRSFRLPHVGLSAQHNELMALAFASQAVVWHRYLLEDMGFGDWVELPSVVLGDNRAANTVARNQRLTVQNRFYSRLCNYAKECYELGKTSPRWAGTADNIADGFTKAVTVVILLAHYGMLMGHLPKPPVPPEPRG
jgi:hypothetical protein